MNFLDLITLQHLKKRLNQNLDPRFKLMLYFRMLSVLH